MTAKPKRPAAFALDREDVVIAPPVETPIAPRPGVVEPDPTPKAPPRASWLATAFWSGLAALVSLGFGLAAARLIEDLFARFAVAGWIGLAALALTLLAGFVLLAREVTALRRLARLDRIRERAEKAVAEKDDKAAAVVAADLIAALSDHAATARGRARYVEAIKDQVVDGRSRLRLLEREALEPLDREATRLVAEAARRVSLVTAASPRAALDLAVVFATAMRLIRQLAELYGGRPGSLAMWRLARQTLAHLAITGGMAAGDTLLDQLVGQGLVARLSAKLGEGVLNGFLTARLGVTAIAVTRPLPYIGAPKPDLRDLAGDALSFGRKDDAPRA